MFAENTKSLVFDSRIHTLIGYKCCIRDLSTFDKSFDVYPPVYQPLSPESFSEELRANFTHSQLDLYVWNL